MYEIKDVEHAILSALMSKPDSGYNELLTSTRSFHKCSIKKFEKHRKNLIKNKVLKREKIKGKQNVKYSINFESSKETTKLLKAFLDQLKYHKTKINSQEFATMWKFVEEKKKGLTKKFAREMELSVNFTLMKIELLKWEPLLTKSPFLHKLMRKELEVLFDSMRTMLEKELRIIATGDSKFRNYYFMLLFNKMKSNQDANVLKSF